MRSLLGALALIVLPACWPQQGLAEKVFEGVEHRVIDTDNHEQIDAIVVTGDAVNVHIVSSESEYNAKKYEFNVYDSMTISDYADKTGALALVSGGFLSSFSPPKELGAIVVNGKQISRPISTWLGTGMFCVKGNNYVITEFDLGSAREFNDCVQAGPLFIRDGHIRYSESGDISADEEKLVKSNQMQSFVCTTDGKEFVIGVSTEMHLDVFARVVREKLRCANALKLTGYLTAGLYFSQKLVAGKDDLPLTSVIGIFK